MQRSRWLPIGLLAALALSSPALARADGLSAGESDRLMRGDLVVRTQRLAQAGHRYVGGVSYAILDASADEVAQIVGDVEAWRRVLPKTRTTSRVGAIAGDELVEVTHGNALVHATYTMRVRREGQVMRFWMDPHRRHDIDDAWGFLRVEPLADGRTMLSYGILVDMGHGILRGLFEDRVRDLALSVPERVRRLLLERRATTERRP